MWSSCSISPTKYFKGLLGSAVFIIINPISLCSDYYSAILVAGYGGLSLSQTLRFCLSPMRTAVLIYFECSCM